MQITLNETKSALENKQKKVLNFVSTLLESLLYTSIRFKVLKGIFQQQKRKWKSCKLTIL